MMSGTTARQAASDAACDDFISQTLQGISDESVRSYLGRNGDAIDRRVQDCMRQAGELANAGYFQSSHVLATTAIELIVRFLLIRPLLQGAFLSDEWAGFITRRITAGRSAEERELLPAILRSRGIDIQSLRLPTGKALWGAITTDVYPQRHQVVHAAQPTTRQEAQMAIDCAAQLYNQVVLPLAQKLGFTLEITRCWCR